MANSSIPPSGASFTGQSLDEVRGSRWLDAVHAYDRDRARNIWRPSESITPFETEFRIRRKDGVYVWHQGEETQS